MNNIPETTFIDLSVKKREADGYPRIGRSNQHARLLTKAEEQVSFFISLLDKFQVSKFQKYLGGTKGLFVEIF